MPKYTMEIQTTFTKWVEIEAPNYDKAIDKAFEWVEDHDSLHHADIDTHINHVYELNYYEEKLNA